MDKQVLTTGEAAKYCGVNFRTIIRWIDRGHLDAYKLPGRGDNRIPINGFVDFLRKNAMPVADELLSNDRRLLLYLPSNSIESTNTVNSPIRTLAADLRRDQWDVVLVSEPMQLGYLIAKDQPAALLIVDYYDLGLITRLVNEMSKAKGQCVKMARLDLHSTAQEKFTPSACHRFKWPEQNHLLLRYLSDIDCLSKD
jgi:excisionase family DNA binding protein